MDLIIRNFQFVWLEYALIYTTINNLMKKRVILVSNGRIVLRQEKRYPI